MYKNLLSIHSSKNFFAERENAIAAGLHVGYRIFLRMNLFIKEKYAGRFGEVGFAAAPFVERQGADIFFVAGDAHGDAQARLRVAEANAVVYHFVVAIGRFDENLRLVFAVYALFEMF